LGFDQFTSQLEFHLFFKLFAAANSEKL